MGELERAKTKTGHRKLFLTPLAVQILILIIETNQDEGYYDEDFTFVDKNGRLQKLEYILV